MKNSNMIHGFYKHPLYRVFITIKQRCYNENNKVYRWYGGKGITIYKEWLQEPNKFCEWGLMNGWEKGLCLTRRNLDKGFNPSNCLFVTTKEIGKRSGRKKAV